VLIPLSLNRVSDTKTVVALYATFSQVLASLAQVVTGQAADRWGPRRPTFVAFSGVVASAIGLAGFGTEVWGLYTFGILGACSAWSLSTLMPSLVSIAATGEEQGRVVGTLNFLWNMAMMTGAIIGGTLVRIGAGLPYLVAAILNAGAISIAILFFRRTLPQPTPTTRDT
jgi:MFS family permease